MSNTDWIDWHGGQMPVPYGTPVEVEHRDGERFLTGAGEEYAIRWEHDLSCADIVRYRLHKPQSDTAARLEAARRELEAAQAAYEAECRQWEPEGGGCRIREEGYVVKYLPSRDSARQFGTERPTRQLAEQARDAMRIHNRALAYVHDHAPEWDGSDPWGVIYSRVHGKWVEYATYGCIGTVTGPLNVMERLAEDLNSGRVRL